MPDEESEFTGLPGRVQAELTRLRAERQMFTAEQDRLKAKLTGTEQELREATADAAAVTSLRAELAESEGQAAALREELDIANARTTALAGDVLFARHQRDSMRAELLAAREERDRLRLALLDAELVLSAGVVEADILPGGEPSADRQRMLTAERVAAEMAGELDATRRTVSWRVTAPLRLVRRRMNRP
ncbi:hypothetical protein [Amycolatopsis sp. cmx-11-51]|uniref:hypothetical protein n=1 Tax=unclassified Amycolatopsis TaxID=2618356 RepID=UPI0039E4F5C6